MRIKPGWLPVLAPCPKDGELMCAQTSVPCPYQDACASLRSQRTLAVVESDSQVTC